MIFLVFSGQLFGDYHGLGVSARFEAGFPFAIAQGWSGRWLAGARAAFLSTSAYAETGNAAAALRIDDGSATSLQSVLGVELNRQLSSSSLLSLRTRYLHEFADAPEIRASLSSGGAAFTIDEQKPKRDALQLGLGYRQIVGDGMTISVNYDGEFKSESRLHQLTARVLWHF
ncbi:autotransporter outer membrane beta-barrel domain-containing protein [Azonexus hydrophilus]|uniref:autotransporter outer membrane beta-barrel domain-containing protein n=1 Tax=Azonexus hydrophilus TaxID=418702 RepID=UPI00248F5F2A|nr:autotransporter outer membrane beta-barrel domain-containing protein [Azonexus hydrophilus]